MVFWIKVNIDFIPTLDIGGCHSNPCLGGSTCVPVENDANTDYRCECSNDVTGTNCEEATVGGLTYIVFTERKAWTEALEECSTNGYTLTSIYNVEAHEFLLTYTKYVHNVTGVIFFVICTSDE